MGIADSTPQAAAGLSRRDVLRRSALVSGTLVWTVPAVQTLAAPALANGSPVEERPCVHTAFVKYEPGVGFSGSEGEGNATCVLAQCAASNVTVSRVSPTSANLMSGVTKIGSVTATVDPTNANCVFLDFAWVNAGCNVDESSSYYIFKDGNDPGSSRGGCEPNDSGILSDVTVSSTGDQYRICSAGGPGGGLSHVNLCICVRCQLP